MTKGRVFFLAALILLAYFAPQWMPQPARPQPAEESNAVLQGLREIQSRRASDAKKAQALDRVLREADRRKDTLSSEQLAMIEELRSGRADEQRRKVSRRLVNSLEIAESRTLSFADWAAGTWFRAHETYRLHRAQAQRSLWLIAFLLVTVSFGGVVLTLTHVARVSANLGFRISRGWLVVLSFVAIALAIITRTNPWSDFPGELLLAPLLALVGCGFALRIVDFNYPVWNSLVRGCGAPLVSMALSVVYLRLI
jgi:hypothetical protein